MKKETIEVISTISKGRHRTNLMKIQEQKALAYLVTRIPNCISSNMLTGIGFIGSLITVTSFILATYIDKTLLLLGVVGFFINWFGDSLDGRIAYYRQTPRKWYGFSLDITVDWITTILIGAGYIIYVAYSSSWGLVGFIFVVMYGWEMITALLRYKITDKYSIDNGLFGPTEVRILISLILILEVLLPDSIIYSGILACIMLFIANIIDTRKLLHLGNERDRNEKELKEKEKNA